MKKFSKSLSAPDPIPKTGIARATEIMRSGLLFRYGEVGSEELEVSLLEQEFADYISAPYVCGVNSGGCALFLALKAVGVRAGDEVLVNAFTLAPVPGAIDHAGARPVLVDITENYVIDLDDLAQKAKASSAKVLLLSYMRGHIPDMDAVIALCDELDLTLIEDCAHTMGATWSGQHLGTFGAVGCYSTQTFKHINSGEGGLLASHNEDIAAKIVLYSGSYMLYEQNGARPSLDVFERWKGSIPNYSMRMSALAASLLRPQIALLPERSRAWNERYGWLTEGLSAIEGIHLPERYAKEQFVASSLQFTLKGLSATELESFQANCDAKGVHLKWFGRGKALGFTSTPKHWGYVDGAKQVDKSERVMSGLFDMRIPLHLNKEDCQAICSVITMSLKEVRTVSIKTLSSY